MDNKFLNKVVDQIVSETRIDYGMGEIQFPFGFPSFNKTMIYTIDFHVTMDLFSPSVPLPLLLSPSSIHLHSSPLNSFSKHCIEIYGLNKDEVEYIWKKYKKIIKDKIGNG